NFSSSHAIATCGDQPPPTWTDLYLVNRMTVPRQWLAAKQTEAVSQGNAGMGANAANADTRQTQC
ncbi:MAG: hypothetical protein ACE1ZA_03675, partial [Pseudomonadales bacterium]